MAVIESGSGSAIASIGPVSASGLHIIAKPQDYGSLGHYQLGVGTGSIAAGITSNAEIFQFRWSDATRFALIQKVTITGMIATTAFTAGPINIKLTRSTAWTVNGTGGTALTLTDPQLQLRPPLMGATLAADIRVATTAALGAGTKTLDTQDLMLIAAHSSGGVGSATPIIGAIYLPMFDLFECDVSDGEHPLTLSQNEGFSIRVIVPATGVWACGIQVKWAEVAAF